VTGRPGLLVLVAGTGTEVGKTWFTAAVAGALATRGIAVAARKPAQSFEPGSGPTDADVLGAATGEVPPDVCPPEHWYEVAMAPPMAAAALGRPVPTMADLVAGCAFSSESAVGFVESAGGVRSPLADDGDTADLAVAIGPDLSVLVADAGLGTIHAVRTSSPPLDAWPLVVYLNRFDAGDELHRRNRSWLEERDRYAVVSDVAAAADLLDARWRAKLRG
jgi:dethiobiotin synthetase